VPGTEGRTAKLAFEIHVRQNDPGGPTFGFWRDLVYLKAGEYSAGKLCFDELGR
jgi:hypothetical protein